MSESAQAEQPRLGSVTCASRSGFHRMAYWEWGDPANDRVLLCVHGLTRSGRDFDHVARALQGDYRVICPDVAGRGRSDWLIDPANYIVPQYVADMVALVARLQARQIDWIGTSMGGLIGMVLAGTAAASPGLRPDRGVWGLGRAPDVPLGRMVFNDIGPALDLDGLGRIADYVGEASRFKNFADAVAYVRSTSEGFGPHDEQGWTELTEHVFNQQDGEWVKHYDLRLAQPFASQTPEALAGAERVLWRAWEHLPGPVLVLRGQDSDILPASVAQEMLQRNPQARCVEFAGVGHAPTLRSPDQIAAVRDFLLA